MSKDLEKSDKEKVFKRNVLKRLYGKEEEEEELDRDVKQQKLKNEESTSIVSSNFGPSKHAIQSRKVYTVTLPPEGLQVIAESSHTLDLHEDEKESTNTDSSGTGNDDKNGGKDHSSRKKRKRKRNSKVSRQGIIHFTRGNQEDLTDSKSQLTKNQKRKLKKKRSKEKNRKDQISSFVHSNKESEETVKQPRLEEEEKSALFEREKEKLLEFVDGIWDIILAEGRSKGEFHDDDINLKQKFDEFITDSKPDHFELIQSLWSLKSSALMQDRTLVNTKTENVKSRMKEVDYCEVSPSVSIHFCHRCLRASIPLKELLILTGQKAIHCKYEVIIGLKVGTRNGCFQFWE